METKEIMENKEIEQKKFYAIGTGVESKEDAMNFIKLWNELKPAGVDEIKEADYELDKCKYPNGFEIAVYSMEEIMAIIGSENSIGTAENETFWKFLIALADEGYPTCFWKHQ